MTGVAEERPTLGVVSYIVAGCMFMENLDATVIVTALPTMARDFGTQTTILSLGVSAYMVAVAIILPLGGWLAERIGTRTVMCAAILLFALTSAACGAAESVAHFVLARVGQGAAAALMVPVGRLVVLRNTSKTHLAHAIAVLVWPALIAPVIGPPLGGFLTTYASWRWIFYLNLPIAAAGLMIAWRFVPQQKSDARAFDWAGFALVATAMGTIVSGLEISGSGGWSALAPFLFGVLMLVLAIRHLNRAPHRLFSLEPLAIKTFSLTTLSGGALTRIAITATPFLLPLMFQTVLGLSAFEAGALMLAYFTGNFAMKLTTTAMLRGFGFRAILIANGALVAAAIALFAFAGDMPIGVLIALLFASGATRSMQFTAINTLTFADIPPPMTSDANTLNGLAHQIAITVGVVGASLLLQLSAGGGAMAAADFRLAFLAMAGIAFLALIFHARLPVDAGRLVSGHRQSG